MRFRDEHWFLSNMYPCDVMFDGRHYGCVEEAFQAAKSLDDGVRESFVGLGGSEAKRHGRRIALRDDWSDVRVDVMREILASKFSDPDLMDRLQSVHGEIVEENTWNDRFWGVCRGRGENMLGKLLMEVRDGVQPSVSREVGQSNRMVPIVASGGVGDLSFDDWPAEF